MKPAPQPPRGHDFRWCEDLSSSHAEIRAAAAKLTARQRRQADELNRTHNPDLSLRGYHFRFRKDPAHRGPSGEYIDCEYPVCDPETTCQGYSDLVPDHDPEE